MESFSYQLRGTSGCGKTTVARHILEQAGCDPVQYDQERRNPSQRPIVYEGKLFDKRLFVIGCYRPTNGGCDTINKVATTAWLVEQRLQEPESIVFFEGLMISHMLGTVGLMQTRTGLHRNILGFLDTPLELCLERVKQRRLDAGNTKPFNPSNTEKDWPRVHLSRANAMSQGYTVVRVRHQLAVQDVMNQIEAQANGLPLPGRVSSMDQWPLGDTA